MPSRWIAALFAKFQGRYGSKFSAQYEGIETVAMDEWAKILGDLSAEQIKHGLETWREDWPPSAPEFHKACTGATREIIPPYHRKFETITDRTRLLSSSERDAKRESISANMAQLRAALKGTLDS